MQTTGAYFLEVENPGEEEVEKLSFLCRQETDILFQFGGWGVGKIIEAVLLHPSINIFL